MPCLLLRTQSLLVFVVIVLLAAANISIAEETTAVPPQEKSAKPAAASDAADRQAKLEAGLSKMLSGATLEGSFTVSGPAGDASKLAREKYTLGEVKKVAGDVWLFPARIEYGGKDVTIPIPLPVRWAGDTPVVVVDEVALPGFGTVSARVLFFDGHYVGYWKHGTHSGNLFGEIRPKGEKPEQPKPSGSNPPAEKKSQ